MASPADAPECQNSFNPAIAILVVLGLWLRIGYFLFNFRAEYDPAITYLAATGNQVAYIQVVDSAIAAGTPLTTGSIRALFFPGVVDFQPFIVTENLYATDVHPPLYFILTNLWFSVFGAGHIAIACFLNLLFDGLSLLLLYVGVRRILGAKIAANTAILLWLFSPAVLESSLFARQYALGATLAIALVVSFYLLFTENKRQYLYVTVAATTLGMLTHYWFAALGFGLGLWGIGRVLKDRRLLLPLLVYAATGAAVVVFWLALGFLDQVTSKVPDIGAAGVQSIPAIASEALSGLANCCAPDRVWWVIESACALAHLDASVISAFLKIGVVVGCGTLVVLYYHYRIRTSSSAEKGYLRYVIFVALVSYVVFITPSFLLHLGKNDAKYLFFWWPLVLTGLAILLDGSRFRLVVVGYFVLVSTVSIMLDIVGSYYRTELDVLTDAPLIVVDTTERGFLGSLTYYLPEGIRILPVLPELPASLAEPLPPAFVLVLKTHTLAEMIEYLDTLTTFDSTACVFENKPRTVPVTEDVYSVACR